MSFIVAVDGPAGSGKGTITKRIEKELGLVNLDTGATYRCVALEALRHGLTVNDEEEIVKLLDNMDIKIENEGEKDIIYLNGEDVTKAIRETHVTEAVSPMSAIIPVREKMIKLQRKLAEGKNVIVEGRDIGTVVFPHADLKIYLDADEEIRAKRRYEESIKSGIDITYDEVLKHIQWRDMNDKSKKVGALRKADDAIVIDTSDMTIEEVVQTVKREIERRMSMKEKKDVTIETMQGLVSEMVKRYGLETTPELRYVDLTTEVGELGKELLKGSNYGKKTLEKTDNLESEMGDTLFSLTCIANSLNIDLQTALVNVMKKYQKRFNEKGSIGSEEIEIEK